MELIREYLQLTKPRVVALLVFCAVIGMFLAVPGFPPWRGLVFGTLYVRSGGNLWPSTLAHGLTDTLALVLIAAGAYAI